MRQDNSYFRSLAGSSAGVSRWLLAVGRLGGAGWRCRSSGCARLFWSRSSLRRSGNMSFFQRLQFALRVGIDDDLPLVTQIERLEIRKPLLPFLNVGHVGQIAREKILSAEMKQHGAAGVRDHHARI